MSNISSLDIKATIDQLGTDYKALEDRIPQLIKAGVQPVADEQAQKISGVLSQLEEHKGMLENVTAAQRKYEAVRSNLTDGLSELDRKQRETIIKSLREIAKPNAQENLVDTLDVFRKALSTTNDPAGAVLIKPYFDNAILVLMQEYTDMRKYAATMTISTDTYIRLKVEDNLSVNWDDGLTPPNDINTNKYVTETINIKNATARIPIAQNLIDDAFIDLDAEIIRQAARAFAYSEADAFMNGDGIGKPRGILTYPNGTTWDTWEYFNSGSATAITYPALVNMVYSLLSFYVQNAIFMAHRTTLAQLRLITYGANFPVPMWQPSLIPGQPSTLMGFPVVYSPSMPVFATGSSAIAFGDFSKGYKIVDRLGMQLLKDPYTTYPIVRYLFRKRMGAGQEDYRAIKIMQIST